MSVSFLLLENRRVIGIGSTDSGNVIIHSILLVLLLQIRVVESPIHTKEGVDERISLPTHNTIVVKKYF